MLRSVLLVAAGILAATCSACVVPPPPAMAQGQVVPAAQPLAIVCDPNNPASFATFVQKLHVPFNPSPTNTDPASDGPVDLDIQTDLQNAFGRAPYFFRKQLCGLDGVFIGPPGASWGFRNATNKKRYIAIPADLWSTGTPARRLPLSYHAFETAVVNRLLNGWPDAQYPAGLGGPGDSGLTTILGALAHEYGHILWYDTYVPNPRDPANFNNFCAGTFYAESWDTISDTPPANRWLPWGYQSSSTHKQDDVQIDDILTAPSGQTGVRLARIFRVHGPLGPPYGRWANLFAAFSPEEDFVETFKLFVLQGANPPLKSLKIQIRAGAGTISPDIPKTIASRPVLQRKLACFAHAPFVASP